MNDHGEFIRVTRQLGAVTNLTPNAIRVSMRRYVRQQTAAQKRAEAKPEGTVPVSRDLPPLPGGMGFPPKPFQPDAAPNDKHEPVVDALQPGTAVTTYGMTTNRTTVDPTPADDSWTLLGGPSPAGGGPYDGVLWNMSREFTDGVVDNYQVDKAGGGTYTIESQTFWVYSRVAVYDSSGRIFSISAESLATTFELITIT